MKVKRMRLSQMEALRIEGGLRKRGWTRKK